MRKSILSFLAVVFCTSVFAQKIINDPNAEKRTVSSFHGIEVATGIELSLTQGTTEEVAVSAAQPAYRDRIVTKVENGILKIYYDSKAGAINKQKRNQKPESLCFLQNAGQVTGYHRGRSGNNGYY